MTTSYTEGVLCIFAGAKKVPVSKSKLSQVKLKWYHVVKKKTICVGQFSECYETNPVYVDTEKPSVVVIITNRTLTVNNLGSAN